MKFITNNWGLKLLALILAIVLYHSLKTDTAHPVQKNNDRSFFQYR